MSGDYHFTSNTVSASKHCKKCWKVTPHRVGGDHKARGCLVCLYQLDPRILSVDELSVLGITKNQLKVDICAKQKEKEQADSSASLRNDKAKQEVLFA